MKIIYVHQKYDYGRPELGLSNEHQNYYGSLVNMKDKGVETIPFLVDVMSVEKDWEAVNRELRELVSREKPNAVFFSGVGGLKRELIGDITEKSGATTFTWAFDDHWAFFKTGKHNAFLFHWVFTTDPLAPGKYQKVGYRHAVFMPQGYNHVLYKPLDLPKKYDVSFVGRPHGVRGGLIEKLEAKGIQVACFGDGWPSGRIPDEEMTKVFCQSKINLNFSESSGSLLKQIGLIFLKRDIQRNLRPVSPARWADNFRMLLGQRRKQIKGRIFKIIGCKGFLLSGDTEGLRDLYEPGKEIELFSNTDELIEKIQYYLVNEEEREQIAQAGWERGLQEHTCEKRFEKMFALMGLTKNA